MNLLKAIFKGTIEIELRKIYNNIKQEGIQIIIKSQGVFNMHFTFKRSGVIFLVLFSFSFSDFLHSNAKDTKTSGRHKSEKLQMIDLASEMSIAGCKERNLKDKIIFIVSKYCSHCRKAKPRLEKVIKELKLEKYYSLLDVSRGADRSEIESHRVKVMFTPTLLINCTVFIGAKTEEVYRAICRQFVNKSCRGVNEKYQR